MLIKKCLMFMVVVILVGCGRDTYYEADVCRVVAIEKYYTSTKNMSKKYSIHCNNHGLYVIFYSDKNYKIDDALIFESKEYFKEEKEEAK